MANIDQHKEETMKVIYHMFTISMSQPVQQNWSSKRKQIPTGTMEIDPKNSNMSSRGHKI